jgi:predicted phosphodiesterase
MLDMLFDHWQPEKMRFFHGDAGEQRVQIAGKNILLVHGESKTLQGDIEKGIGQLCGKYAINKVDIDFVLFGHIHYARIGDHFARSGSLVGANSYSDHGLNLMSRASQNIHIITDTGQIHSMKLDLQDVDAYGTDGYPYSKRLEAYNAKSASKNHIPTKILEVVI